MCFLSSVELWRCNWFIFPPSGCLLFHLRRHQELLQKPHVLLHMSVQICSALAYLERKKFIHRDLVWGTNKLLSQISRTTAFFTFSRLTQILSSTLHASQSGGRRLKFYSSKLFFVHQKWSKNLPIQQKKCSSQNSTNWTCFYYWPPCPFPKNSKCCFIQGQSGLALKMMTLRPGKANIIPSKLLDINLLLIW